MITFAHNLSEKSRFMFKKVIKYPISSVLVLIIWVVCMIPVPETPLDNISMIDKWTHFVMYGTLTLAIWIEYFRKHNSETLSKKRLAIGGCLLPVIMGGAVELAQAYLTTCRSGDWFDFLCNSIGVLLGCLIGILLAKCLAR